MAKELPGSVGEEWKKQFFSDSEILHTLVLEIKRFFQNKDYLRAQKFTHSGDWEGM